MFYKYIKANMFLKKKEDRSFAFKARLKAGISVITYAVSNSPSQCWLKSATRTFYTDNWKDNCRIEIQLFWWLANYGRSCWLYFYSALFDYNRCIVMVCIIYCLSILFCLKILYCLNQNRNLYVGSLYTI